MPFIKYLAFRSTEQREGIKTHNLVPQDGQENIENKEKVSNHKKNKSHLFEFQHFKQNHIQE
jgi:hypothetical protein